MANAASAWIGGYLFKAISRPWPLFALACALSTGALAQQRPPILNLGDAVVTGFSGTILTPAARLGAPVVDRTFINPEGASARVIRLAKPGYAWDGRLFTAPKMFDVRAKDIGQVFGIALDNQQVPNIYLGATSAFGLNIVGRTIDGRPERRKIGGPGTAWMKGQFGLDLQGDPGSIYKVDGRNGAVTLFAQVMLNGVPNPGTGLGGLTYDAAHQQLLAVDLHTGMVHRFSIGTGNEAGSAYDHGISGRKAAKLPPIAYNAASRPNIANNRFKADDPQTWGYAPPERRVWALAMHQGRLFYSVRNGAAKDGAQIWSVGIASRDGSFAEDAQLETEVPAQPGPFPVTDIAFTQQGSMILAQRVPTTGSYDYVALTHVGEPRVLRFHLKDPNDPPSPGRWKPQPEEYAVGFAGKYRNSNGGVALGYGYDEKGMLLPLGCEASLWVTAQSLRNAPPLQRVLEPGGPLVVHGIFGVPSGQARPFNEPPWFSYPVDYDDRFDDPNASGHLGGVRIFTTPCATGVASGSPPGGASGGAGGPSPRNPPPHDPPKACFASSGTFECVQGHWIYKLTANGPSWINTVSATSLTSGVTVSGGSIPLNPASIGVSGTPGSTALIEVCAFDAAAAASGKPYDCCRTKLTIKIPAQKCGG